MTLNIFYHTLLMKKSSYPTITFNQVKQHLEKKEKKSLSTFLDHFLNPGSVFGNLSVDVGYIWIIAILVQIERDDAHCYTLTHQGSTRITLQESHIKY